jgi:outer membrane receptor for Fe3+-dicitrate
MTGSAIPAGNQYFPSTMATNPDFGHFRTGPARIGAIRGFGIANENVSLIKNTAFGNDGRYKLQLRVEFYNIFNRHTFAQPDTQLNSPTFGYVTGVNSTPRQGQSGVRFEF